MLLSWKDTLQKSLECKTLCLTLQSTNFKCESYSVYIVLIHSFRHMQAENWYFCELLIRVDSENYLWLYVCYSLNTSSKLSIIILQGFLAVNQAIEGTVNQAVWVWGCENRKIDTIQMLKSPMTLNIAANTRLTVFFVFFDWQTANITEALY